MTKVRLLAFLTLCVERGGSPPPGYRLVKVLATNPEGLKRRFREHGWDGIRYPSYMNWLTRDSLCFGAVLVPEGD